MDILASASSEAYLGGSNEAFALFGGRLALRDGTEKLLAVLRFPADIRGGRQAPSAVRKSTWAAAGARRPSRLDRLDGRQQLQLLLLRLLQLLLQSLQVLEIHHGRGRDQHRQPHSEAVRR